MKKAIVIAIIVSALACRTEYVQRAGRGLLIVIEALSKGVA